MSRHTINSINSLIKKNKIEVIDLKCIDLAGRLHHISLPVYDNIMTKLTKEGVGFDGSSYGFRKVENSDMILIPDLDTAVIDLVPVKPLAENEADIKAIYASKLPALYEKLTS